MEIRKNIFGIKFRSRKLENRIRKHLRDSSVPASHLENMLGIEERVTYRSFLSWLANKYSGNKAIEMICAKLDGNIAGRYVGDIRIIRPGADGSRLSAGSVLLYDGAWDRNCKKHPDASAEKAIMFHEIGHHNYRGLSERQREKIERNFGLVNGAEAGESVSEQYAWAYSACAQSRQPIEPLLLHFFRDGKSSGDYRQAVRLYRSGASVNRINRLYT